MSTATLISVEEYLRTSYEHDCEFVEGDVVERGVPTFWHGLLQARFIVLFEAYRHTKSLRAVPETRCKLAHGVIRIPDVAVFSPPPEVGVPTDPPLVAIEIVSPDDRYSALIQKCEEYRHWGVRHVWIVDPQTQKLSVYGEDGWREVKALAIDEFGVLFTAEQIFD